MAGHMIKTSRGGQLQRQIGLFGAIMMGLGSMVGTGVFVSIGIAAGIAGPSVALAVAVAALVAACNGLSSAQLAASYPVSGGTYEYGYQLLNPWLGFTAGWMFLIAKTASAATAALGFAGYALSAAGPSHSTLIPLALAAVAVLTVIVLSGIRRSNTANSVIVSITLFSLIVFVVAGLPVISAGNLTPFFAAGQNEAGAAGAFFHACALMFVAYTGYGRIATLGEEVREPRQVIPRAIIATMLVTMGLYVAVTVTAIGAAGVSEFSQAATGAAGTQAAPLAVVAQRFPFSIASPVLTISAITAMLGVLLNLILGLSRVLLAMGRRGDMPSALARVNAAGTTPYWAVLVVGAAIALLALTGNVRATWSFSAFTVLIYYALTNAAALRLPAAQRLFPAWIAWAGLAACLFLAFWVEPHVWLAGLGLIAAGLVWHAIARARRTPAHPSR